MAVNIFDDYSFMTLDILGTILIVKPETNPVPILYGFPYILYIYLIFHDVVRKRSINRCIV